ncbi:hypothetical protein GGU10DRAFT_291912, partial [Lentinula aff. detonsa]
EFHLVHVLAISVLLLNKILLTHDFHLIVPGASSSSSPPFVSELNLPAGLSSPDTTWLDFLSSTPAPSSSLGGLSINSVPTSWGRG